MNTDNVLGGEGGSGRGEFNGGKKETHVILETIIEIKKMGGGNIYCEEEWRK